jgi:hypothetical protein
MGYLQKYMELWLTQLDEGNAHRLRCDYKYLLTIRCTNHWAFKTRPEMEMWFQQRGLAVPAELPADANEWWSGPVDGGFNQDMMWDDAPEFWTIEGDYIRDLDNGSYTLGIVTTDETGWRTVHILNCNCKDRVEFDYFESDALRRVGDAG